MKTAGFLLCALFLPFVSDAAEESRGVIDSPDGVVNVRASESDQSEVVATVKIGEPFEFDCQKEAEWCKVSLPSGKTGWMQRSRIRLHFTEKDLPSLKRDPAGLSEIEEFAKGRGLNYAAVTRSAARGDAKALKQFFAMAQDVDGAAAESYSGMPTVVYHLLGDQKFARFLQDQPLSFRMMVRNQALGAGLTASANLYLRQHFPETAKALFRLELVDWPSPNKRYAIRKVFSDEFNLTGSKVTRAEVIEQAGGRVLCDLTPEDIGTGADREGKVLWSPDSKRFAYISSDLTRSAGNLFSTPRPAPQRKQTAVYQLSGDSFALVEIPFNEVPGRDADTELQGAILGHDYVEPLRWSKPNVLVLEKHEYYENLKPLVVGDEKFDTIHSFDRLRQITVTIGPDAKATTVWKLRTDR
jgi:Bacterial SH3 domain